MYLFVLFFVFCLSAILSCGSQLNGLKISRVILAAAKTVYVVSTRCTAAPVAQSGAADGALVCILSRAVRSLCPAFSFADLDTYDTATAVTFYQSPRFVLKVV